MSHAHPHPLQEAMIAPHTAAAMRRVTVAAIAVAFTLVALKSGAWAATNAVSLVSSLADSLFDGLTSIINFFAVRYALKPADADHRYGHNSIEDIAGLAQFAFICGSMLFIAAQSIHRLFDPEPLEHLQVGAGVMLISLFLTAMLVLYQRHVFRQSGSLIIRADMLHYLSDILSNLAVLLSLFLVALLGWWWVDAILAVVIAVYVIYSALEIGVRSYNNMMDRELPDSEKAELIALIDEMPDIRGYHRLRTRASGMRLFIELHLELDRHLSFVDAHAISERLEQQIKARFPMADIMLHQDPV